MKSPCGSFLWQLVEPEPWMDGDDSPESLQRIGFGVPDVGRPWQRSRRRAWSLSESTQLHPEDRGALTRAALGSVAFELVHQ